MGFKTMNSYNDERFGNFFRLQNDGDYADVVFLYRSTDDVMMADTHYIKSDSYSGYVTCTGKGCPACAKQVRIQPKLFVPLYVISTSSAAGGVDKVQFWDRTLRFQPQLLNDVFRGYPNPSEFIFRITRHGVAGDINTTYDIRAVQPNNNPITTYDGICSRFGMTFPDSFNLVCKDVDMFELSAMMSETGNTGNYGRSGNAGSANGGSYGAVPRGGTPAPNPGNIPGTQIPYTNQPDAPNLSMPSVPLNTDIPDAAPNPEDLPFGDDTESGSANPAVTTPPPTDPLETNQDIDTTNLTF